MCRRLVGNSSVLGTLDYVTLLDYLLYYYMVVLLRAHMGTIVVNRVFVVRLTMHTVVGHMVKTIVVWNMFVIIAIIRLVCFVPM